MKEKRAQKKRKTGRKLSLLLLLGAVSGGLGWLMPGIGVTAAEELIQLSDISVSAREDGICAGCTYRNFDSSIYMVQLYLEKQNGDETIPVVYQNLSSASEEEQRVQTEICRGGTGIYRAVLLTRAQGDTIVVSFQDSGWYEAVDRGDHYEVRPYVPDSGEAEASQEEGIKEEEHQADDEYGICGHRPVREIYAEATPQSDAVFYESCELCGQVLAYGEIPNTAYVSFLEETTERIRNAQPDEQIVVTTDRWLSFDRRVLEAIGERADLSILLQYRDQGEERQILLPAGTDVISLGDENGFCGFRYLFQIFGTNIGIDIGADTLE
ncbi:MAG: hypothetical protein NC429_02110 [Lachnospiraceae bacterium]|nr:hypothetical protein [Lachnospiraceae bacterium]